MQPIPQPTTSTGSRIRRDSASQQAQSGESKSERVSRIYRTSGGPLMGCLFDEAHSRGHDGNEMAEALGVTAGYVNQLRNGIRKTQDIPQAFAEACSRYIDSKPIVVKLLAGSIRLTDFLAWAETEEVAIDRGIQAMMADTKVRAVLPDADELATMSLEAKRALVLLYSEVSSSDVFNTRELPNMLFWLQRAAIAHDDNSFEAVAGHRDTDVRG